MKTLGIDCSTLRCDIALAEHNGITASQTLAPSHRPTGFLIPAIRDLCNSIGWKISELERIAVSVGPGSFTGLRVALTCAKILAYSNQAQLVTAKSLDTAVRNVKAPSAPLSVAFDAARKQVFCRAYKFESNWIPTGPIQIVTATDWANSLSPDTRVLGPALEKYNSLIKDKSNIESEELWWPRASELIHLTQDPQSCTPVEEFWELEPLYMRLSAAEEKKQAQEGI